MRSVDLVVGMIDGWLRWPDPELIQNLLTNPVHRLRMPGDERLPFSVAQREGDDAIALC